MPSGAGQQQNGRGTAIIIRWCSDIVAAVISDTGHPGHDTLQIALTVMEGPGPVAGGIQSLRLCTQRQM
jgi:hypothetical protein